MISFLQGYFALIGEQSLCKTFQMDSIHMLDLDIILINDNILKKASLLSSSS